MIYLVDTCHYVTTYFNFHACNNNTFELLVFVIYSKCLLSFFMICRSVTRVFTSSLFLQTIRV